jgi:hypothetical protein
MLRRPAANAFRAGFTDVVRRWLDDDIRFWLGQPAPVTRRKQLGELGKPLAGLLAAADGTAQADLAWLAGRVAPRWVLIIRCATSRRVPGRIRKRALVTRCPLALL